MFFFSFFFTVMANRLTALSCHHYFASTGPTEAPDRMGTDLKDQTHLSLSVILSSLLLSHCLSVSFSVTLMSKHHTTDSSTRHHISSDLMMTFHTLVSFPLYTSHYYYYSCQTGCSVHGFLLNYPLCLFI